MYYYNTKPLHKIESQRHFVTYDQMHKSLSLLKNAFQFPVLKKKSIYA